MIFFPFYEQKLNYFEVPMFNVNFNYGNNFSAVCMTDIFVRTLGMYEILKHTNFSEIIETDAPSLLLG